jgi:hypothetical protein
VANNGSRSRNLIAVFNMVCKYRFLISLLSSFFILSGCAIHKNQNVVVNQSDLSQLDSHKASSLKTDSLKTLIAEELLQADVDRLVSLVKEIHPEPFSLISEQQFQNKADSIKRSLKYPLSKGEFYLRVAPLMAEIGDIHSSVKLPKFSENNQNKLFPLAVLYEEDALFVAADLSSDPKVPVGAIIKTINDAPIDFILQVMKRLIVHETDSGHRRKIQVNFPWLLMAMGYGNEEYKLNYLWNGKVKSQILQGLVRKNQGIKKDDNAVAKITKTVSFYGASNLTSQTALLWFNDFNETPSVFSAYLKNQFETIEKQSIRNLIIDLRYNDGGLSQNIKTLLSYITDEPIHWAQLGEIRTSEALKKLHRKKTKQHRKDKYQWGLQWLPLEWTDYLQYEISLNNTNDTVIVEFEAVEPLNVDKPDNVIVLVNGFCFSACSSLVAVVNHYQLANTVGETTGSFAQVQYAYPLTSQLPHSELELLLPTMKLIFNRDKPNRRMHIKESNSLIKPSIQLKRSQSQIINREDTVMLETLKRLEGRSL